MMKKIFLLSLLLVLTMNYSQAQVYSDYKKDVDFTKYKTYSFSGWEKASDEKISSFDKERILTSFKNELESRGFTVDNENPDVKITLFVVVSQHESNTAYTSYMGGLGYFHLGWGWGTGMGYSSTIIDKQYYNEGVIVLDMFDTNTKKLVWEGIVKTIVDDRAEKREKTIPKKIKKLMKKYPVKPMK